MSLDLTGFGSIFDFGKDIIDKIWPDPATKAKAQADLLAAQQAGAFKELDANLQLALEQIKANAVEAAQPGTHFRDGAGWVCVAAFAIMTLKAPIEWVSVIAGHPITLPVVDTSTTTDMLIGLLGLGGMHLYSQVKG